MPLTIAEYKQQIIQEVCDTPSAILAANIDRYWKNGDREASYELQFLKAKMTAIRAVMGEERRTDVDSVGLGGVSMKLQQRIETLKTMLKDTQAEYMLAIASIGSYGGVADVIATVAPVSPPAGAVDANSLDYSGSPYRRR